MAFAVNARAHVRRRAECSAGERSAIKLGGISGFGITLASHSTEKRLKVHYVAVQQRRDFHILGPFAIPSVPMTGCIALTSQNDSSLGPKGKAW